MFSVRLGPSAPGSGLAKETDNHSRQNGRPWRSPDR